MSSPVEELGPYRLIRRIGQGGSAEVYLAERTGLGGFSRRVAVKRLRPELQRDAPFVKMLIEEARLSSRLTHRTIVQVLDFALYGSEYVLAMELVEGEHLGVLLERARAAERPLPVGVVCHLIGELAAALGYAHALSDEQGRPLGIVHRDVSPSNIMVSRDGTVKLLDFGIAKALHALGDERTRTGVLKGKVSYFSPEQAEGRPLGPRSDLFSLGVVAYQCLTLVSPFHGLDAIDSLRLVREGVVRAPSEIRPSLPAQVEEVVLRLLARAPGDRFDGGEAVQAALAPLAHQFGGGPLVLAELYGELVPQTGSPAPSPKVALTALPGAARQGTVALAGSSPRKVWLIGAVGVAALIALALVVRHAVAPRPPPVQVAAAAHDLGAVLPPPPPMVIEAPPAAVPLPPRVHVRVDGTRGAAVRIDDRELGQIPLAVDLPRDRAPHTLYVRLHGHQPIERPIALDRDRQVEARLAALPAHPARRARPGDRHTAEISDPYRR